MPTGKEGEMLLGHNEPVYKNLCETLEKHKKAIVVTFTGGGKSFLASEYLAESGLHALVVCPKRTICSQWAALNQSVDTMTYSAFAKVPLEDLLRYEAVILDEAHHCGSRVWGARAKELTENTAGVVIGLTADSVRWSDGGKDVAQELFDGHIVKGYSLQEAIEQNIVRPFSYVCTIIGFNRMIQERVERLSNGKLDARLRAKAEHLIARLKLDAEAAASVTDVLRQYMPANPKGIVFTDDIAAIEEARGLMNEAFPDMSCYTIHSKQSKEKNEAQLAAFMQAPTACIISVNMLGEDDVLECFKDDFCRRFPSFQRTEPDTWIRNGAYGNLCRQVILENGLFYVCVEDNEWSLAVELIQKEEMWGDVWMENLQKRLYQKYLDGMKTSLLKRLPGIGTYKGAWTSGRITNPPVLA